LFQSIPKSVRRPPSPSTSRGEGFCNTWCAVGQSARPSESVTANPLRDHFHSHSEGPGIWKWLHYFDIYHRHLSRFVGTDAQIVEIGVYSGGSLQMWRQYFGDRCRIAGIDIEEACRLYVNDCVKIFIGDQADRQFWAEFRQEVPSMDVVLDDGGHEPEQQMVTLEETLPYLRPGGVYICEDIHGVGNRFAAFAHDLADNLNAARWNRNKSLSPTACDATPFQASIHSVHCYPFVVVIETNPAPVDTFAAPKRGTQWQPFL
jgi:Methyltransferase domain